jgi:hypothetical protein
VVTAHDPRVRKMFRKKKIRISELYQVASRIAKLLNGNGKEVQQKDILRILLDPARHRDTDSELFEALLGSKLVGDPLNAPMATWRAYVEQNDGGKWYVRVVRRRFDDDGETIEMKHETIEFETETLVEAALEIIDSLKYRQMILVA